MLKRKTLVFFDTYTTIFGPALVDSAAAIYCYYSLLLTWVLMVALACDFDQKMDFE
jgi:hypothetical protein